MKGIIIVLFLVASAFGQLGKPSDRLPPPQQVDRRGLVEADYNIRHVEMTAYGEPDPTFLYCCWFDSAGKALSEDEAIQVALRGRERGVDLVPFVLSTICRGREGGTLECLKAIRRGEEIPPR